MGLLGDRKRGLLFVVSAPAGTGKTTLVEKLSAEFSSVVKSISCTTRAPRKGEINGVDYHFISEAEFEEKIAEGAFLEYAKVFGTAYYGTLASDVERQLESGNDLFLVIDTQGAMWVKKRLDALLIFIAPPSIDVQRQRLTLRQTEPAGVIENRLACAQREMESADKYDYYIVNDELMVAYAVLRSILIAERHSVKNNLLMDGE